MIIKEYRDPLYGFITLDELEQKIVETPFFQRLRYIMQLGTTYLIYPSGVHTRFEHSLGVLQASSFLFDHIISDSQSLKVLKKWEMDDPKEYRILLRLASLLHDIGHGPFSHTLEDLFPKNMTHEDYTYKIITETEIGEVIDKELGNGHKERIAGISTGKPKSIPDSFLSMLISGEIGSDRVDYLHRDSYHLGVAYGRFDYYRFLTSLHVRDTKEGPELGIDEGGINVIESFVLARYFMFLQVYFHKTRRIFDKHLVEFLKTILPEDVYPSSLDEFRHWIDPRILWELEEKRDTSDAKRIIRREHFRLVRGTETSDQPSLEEIEEFNTLMQKVVDKFGGSVWIDDQAEKDPLNFKEPTIFILRRGKYIPLQKISPLIRNLRRISKRRIYAETTIREDVEKFVSSLRNKGGQDEIF